VKMEEDNIFEIMTANMIKTTNNTLKTIKQFVEYIEFEFYLIFY